MTSLLSNFLKQWPILAFMLCMMMFLFGFASKLIAHEYDPYKKNKSDVTTTGAIKSPQPKHQGPTKNDKALLKAKFACASRLATLGVHFDFIPAIQNGRCGNLSPVKLSKVGSIVAIKPPATVNCHFTEKLDLWMRKTVQPAAKHFFKEPIVSIQNIASYACRHRYNNPKKKLSEHAKANALDIASFTTKSGKKIDLKTHWKDQGAKGMFLRYIHKGACKTFVVVLGPNANKAHENHFHFDLGRWPVCE